MLTQEASTGGSEYRLSYNDEDEHNLFDNFVITGGGMIGTSPNYSDGQPL